ncbi:homocysteine S-methyltransferase [Desulfobacter hydrogenophilus]|uniref:S-methylmethionine:homocysteine methyltransferase n=1 Tax=Desulfobacter hydrogenophilus TaxID=2291 RepID=A0A328FFN1_9BACT|nr:homocysteine S-methyltransferase [Desulfobacter hydrogenophilus]NDY70760.1 homocysteine S-methyltransferase [Desulfobacter hydrogenophilus]QBH12629.1 homocysteine S-methyltransferase [Desulfobacter hydrogenophilus]RAM03408.1 homocysteine S-methyltransferase [Desulfobacter hydrogenophilus]
MADVIRAYLKQKKYLIIDGALGTELERRGCNLDDPLWSARLLADNPEMIAAVHTDYLHAGADCLITASYQATFQGLARHGFTHEQAQKLIQSAVILAKTVVNAFWADPANRVNRLKPLVGASVGPYGAFLTNRSEYTGNYGISEDDLVVFHKERLKTLVSAGPDFLACETLPCFAEARVLVRLLENLDMIPAWFSFSARDGQHINSGEAVRDCAQWLDDKPCVAAMGINCTDPVHVVSLVKEIRSVTDKPVVVYPNKGEQYNNLTKSWAPKPGRPSFGEMATQWAKNGARLIGGCCHTTPDDICQLAVALKS